MVQTTRTSSRSGTSGPVRHSERSARPSNRSDARADRAATGNGRSADRSATRTAGTTHEVRPPPAPVALPGTLIVKWINGRNGDFAVGELSTSIGAFKVKDALLDQFEEGSYHGTFWISQIYSKAFESYGRITIETRANLADLRIDEEDEAPPEAPVQLDADPVDELPTPAERRPEPAVPPTPSTSRRVSGRDGGREGGRGDLSKLTEADGVLFGADICDLIAQRQELKLDPTVERMLLRQQTARLAELRYQFYSKTQTWGPRS